MNSSIREFPLEKVGFSTLAEWVEKAHSKESKRILISYADYHYSSYCLKNNENEEEVINDIDISGDTYEGSLDIEEIEKYLKSLINK